MANSEPLQVSIIGMPGSGKTVLISIMAMRMVQMMETGVYMTPAGAERHRTHKYVAQNWLMLNNGQWPESTPIGEQVNLQWELKTQKNTAAIRFSDCAGQDIHKIFSDDNFDSNRISKDVKPVYNILVKSDIVLVLINMEDLIGRNAAQSAANGADLDLMISTLLEDPEKERKIVLVINQYDRYKAEVDNLFNGDLNKYLRQRLPLLYAQHMRQKNMSIIPVAAVAETNTIEQNCVISLVPAPDFKSFNLESLITWIADGVDELAQKKEPAVKKAMEEEQIKRQQEKEAIDEEQIRRQQVKKVEEEQIKRQQEKEAEFKLRVFYGSCAVLLLTFLVCVFGWLCRPEPQEPVKAGTNAGDRITRTVNGVEFAFRWCPAGTFTMGSPTGEEDREDGETQHEVTHSKGFWMLETEVTQRQWQAIMGNNPSDFKGDNYPVEQVSWDDCQEFCKKFNSESGLQIGLPTESQWEYACRAGTTGTYAGDLDSVAWYGENSGSKTHPVGTKQPNAWGLYDMHGNVWEWCSDWYGDYPSGSVTDPMGASSGTDRVLRGGSWGSFARNCRAASRNSNSPDYRCSNLGFRPVLVPFDVLAENTTPKEPVKAGINAGDRITRTVNGVKFAFRWCPAGTFMMGSSEDEEECFSDERQHEVTLSQGFWMLETEVTQRQWQAIRGNNPSYFKGDNLPVEQVSWDECQDFCKKFNSESGLQIGLPTESQWEYACRAGTTGAYAGDLDSMTWYYNNSGGKTHPVGTKQSNAWGLSDMHGNVWEWCSDRYGDYPSDSVTDPTGASSSGTNRVTRGGSWNYFAGYCRSAFRSHDSPDHRFYDLGFRFVLVSFDVSAETSAPAVEEAPAGEAAPAAEEAMPAE